MKHLLCEVCCGVNKSEHADMISVYRWDSYQCISALRVNWRDGDLQRTVNPPYLSTLLVRLQLNPFIDL